MPVVPIVISSLKPFVDSKRKTFKRAHLIITVLPPVLPPASLKPRESSVNSGGESLAEPAARTSSGEATSTASEGTSAAPAAADEFSQWVDSVREGMQKVFFDTSAEVTAAQTTGGARSSASKADTGAQKKLN